jgi:hypothetical protein
VAAGYRAVLDAWVTGGAPPEVLDGVATICFGAFEVGEWKRRWAAVAPDQLTLTMTALVDRDAVLDRVPEITCPALVLHGTADLAYPVERATELAAALPGAEAPVVVEGGAHFLSYTHADEVNPPPLGAVLEGSRLAGVLAGWAAAVGKWARVRPGRDSPPAPFSAGWAAAAGGGTARSTRVAMINIQMITRDFRRPRPPPWRAARRRRRSGRRLPLIARPPGYPESSPAHPQLVARPPGRLSASGPHRPPAAWPPIPGVAVIP